MNKNKIKIIYLISSLKRCGPVNVLFSIIKNLNRKKFKIVIVTFKMEGIDSRNKDFLQYGVQIYNEKNIVKGIKRIHSILKGNSESVILHSHGVLPDLVNLFFKKSSCANISTIHSDVFEDYPMFFGNFKGFILAKIHCYILKHLINVACSESVHCALKKKANLNSITIRNGVSFKDSFEDKNIIKKSSQIRQPLKIVYVGSLTKRKNVEFLINSVLKASDMHLELIIVGSGDQYQELKYKYTTFSNIKFCGFKTDPSCYYQLADIVTSASLSEGMPMAILEALSFGCPLLLSNISSHKEIISLGPFGQIFNNNRNSYISCLKRTTELIGSNSDIFKKAKDIFSDEIMTEKYENLYLKIFV